MKKIIKSTALLFCICFIAGPSMAQLSSDAPALTAAQIAELQNRSANAKQQPTTQLSSDGAALNAAQVTEIQKKQIENVKVATTPLPAVKAVERSKVQETTVKAAATGLPSYKTINPEEVNRVSSKNENNAVSSVSTAAKKSAENNNAAAQVAPAKPIFNGTLSSGASTQLSAPVDVNANAATQIPEVKQSQEAQKIEAEIPASVAPAKIKIPDTPKQGGSN